MTKILFLQNVLYEHVGIMYLSASLKRAGHDCDLLIQNPKKRIIKSAIKSDADIIAFSCATGVHTWALEVAKELKKETNKLILFGGLHASLFPELINKPQVDVICLGDGEEAIVELADRIQQGKDITKIKNLWVKKEGMIYKNPLRQLVENLDHLGYPDREIFYKKYGYLRNNPIKHFITSRGCPYDCSFCFNHPLKELYNGKGRYLRRRTVKHVINEIKQVKTKYSLKSAFFNDDTFILNPQWVKEFVRLYKQEINIPFRCTIRADLVNEEVIKNLHKGGCEQISFGIECGNDFLRNKILKKKISKKQIINTGRLLKKYKIKFKTYSMLGLPGETLENAWETVYINQKIKTNYLWCSLLQPLPKTEIYDYLFRHGFLTKSFSLDDLKSFLFLNSRITNKKETINLQRLFFYAVKFPSLEPLIKRLITFKPNILFDIAFYTAQGYMYIQSRNLKIFDSLLFGLKNIRAFVYIRQDKQR